MNFHMSPSDQEGQREPQINPKAAKASAVAIVTLVTATFPFSPTQTAKTRNLPSVFPCNNQGTQPVVQEIISPRG